MTFKGICHVKVAIVLALLTCLRASANRVFCGMT